MPESPTSWPRSWGGSLTDLVAWLEQQLADAPASLRRRTLGAVESVTANGGSLPRALETAAERLLSRVQSAAPTRDTALDLLAADALITLACAARAELDPGRLGEPS